ncbi:MAG: azurin [Verrucomicrobiota bacterium]
MIDSKQRVHGPSVLFTLALAVVGLCAPLQAEEAAEADVKVTISGNDTMQFDVKEFEVGVGQTVELTLKHTGALPKAAMGHNVVILKKEMALMDFAMKAVAAAATEYIPADLAENVLAHTKLIGGGEEDVITFVAPAEAGNYEFLCSFPGHFGLMKGIMIVK